MDMFEFEELMAEMLGVTDEQREDDDVLPDEYYKKYDIEFEAAYNLTKDLLMHTPILQAGLSKKHYHAFVRRESSCMLMKIEV